MNKDSATKSNSARRPSGQGAAAASSVASTSVSTSKSAKSPVLVDVPSIAQRLIAAELQTDGSSDPSGRSVFRVCEKLRQPLASLIGMVGFRSLVARALTLAKAEVPWLGGLQIGPDGALGFSMEMKAELDGDEAARGGTVLITQLLGLLVTFIGEALTLRLVYNVWPKAAATDFKLKGNVHEKNR